MLNFVRVVFLRAYKIGLLNHGEQEAFCDGPNTALSMDSDFDPTNNLKVLSSTLVMLYRATAPLLNVKLWANTLTGSGFTRWTNNYASKNLKFVFESLAFLIM